MVKIVAEPQRQPLDTCPGHHRGVVGAPPKWRQDEFKTSEPGRDRKPVANGIVGRQIASVEGYKYGKDIVALGETGATWTKEELFEYLKDPKKYLRAKLDNKKAKSKMSAKFKKEDDRNNVIAYLESLQPAEEEAATTN